MYNHILIGIDGREGGRDAVALAAALARAETLLTLAHVRVVQAVPARTSGPDITADATDAATEMLAAEAAPLSRRYDTIVVSATSVGAGLAAVADERAADLVVVGACRRGPIGRVLAGDDAASVLHGVGCAVALAPGGYAATAHSPERILVAYDGSEPSRVALATALELGDAGRATVRALSVVTPHVYGVGWSVGTAAFEDPEVLVASARARLGELPGVELAVRSGLVGEDLATESANADLLVCGSRHNSFANRLLLGSTSSYLAHHARCPLLVTPAHDPELTARRLPGAAEAPAS